MLDVLEIIEIDGTEGRDAEIAHRIRLTGADHKVIGLIELQHAPHGIDVIPGKSPVATSLEISESQFVLKPKFDARHGIGDLTRDDFETAPRRFVIEQDAGDREEIKAFAIVHRDPVAVDLGDTIG